MGEQYWVKYASGQVSSQPVPYDAVVQLLQSNAGVAAVCQVGAQEWIPATSFLPPGAGKPQVVDKIGPVDVVKAVVLGLLCGIGAIVAGIIALAKGRKKEGTLYLVCGFACSLIVFSVIKANQSSAGKRDPWSASTESSQPSSAPAAEEAIEVDSISKFVKEYHDNELASDGTYKGKLIKVSGSVETVSKDILDKPYISLNGGGQMEMFGVQCFLDDSAVQSAMSIKKGQRITVKGRVKGRMMNVLVEDCSIQ